MKSAFLVERDKAIVEVARKGVKYEEIGANFHLTKQRVGQICQAAGLRKRIDLFTPMEVSNEHHV